MKLEIQGRDAVVATKELLAIEGLSGSYQILEEVERGEVNTTLVAIATIVGIVGGTLNIAEQLYQWKERYFQNPTGSRIEKVLIVTPNGRRLLLKDATVEQIQEILED